MKTLTRNRIPRWHARGLRTSQRPRRAKYRRALRSVEFGVWCLGVVGLGFGVEAAAREKSARLKVSLRLATRAFAHS